MAFGNDLDAYQGASTSLALVEKSRARSFLGLSWGEAKLLVIAGVGFFMDAYDLFIINMIYAILLRTYKEFKVPQTDRGAPLSNITWGLDGGVLKASANIGNVFGQIIFGFLGVGVTAWMTAFRFIMGIGIGGDYPMSATIVSDRSHAHKRGTLLALIFSNQGWGNLVGAIAAVVVIAAYKGPVTAGDTHKLSGAWRILQGLALIPAFGVLYFRLTLVESTRFTQARQIQDDPELLAKASAAGVVVGESDSDEELAKKGGDTPVAAENQAVGLKFATVGKKPHNEFFEYFSEWRHLRVLLGTILGWFLVDITFYGINLNQSVILQAIGFTTGSTWSKLMKVATGNLIITVAGFLPGYFFTAALIEVIGRKPIQLIGFAMNALFFGILGGKFDEYKAHTNQIFPLFVFLQFFFNFGANATTFIIPAEAFPTRVRASAHGLSAACGKLGAILASLGFSVLADPKKSIGQEKVFWIFFAISILGFIVTVLLVPETKGYDADEVDRKELAEKRGLGAETNPNLHSL
ncbi:Inorganic phosphate transporter [Ceraceosorus bombacis]|uniref:Inorganic phosphate transporter n=1 Tax=Ceraceosorus bombacis TaxID=401625 RepID=A0A0N7L9U4_9BASI|nr:Inorganic phosphate transporter [Ceraceosorus bombacis]